ncbi:MAG: hypothetical protein FD548_000155 [Pelagibacterales bacterium]|nr:hypothetical protein [Pelagibacterales bacterium]
MSYFENNKYYMEFQKKTSFGKSYGIVRLLLKPLIIFFILFLIIIMIDKIEFPSPYKKIEKVLDNENFKIVK